MHLLCPSYFVSLAWQPRLTVWSSYVSWSKCSPLEWMLHSNKSQNIQHQRTTGSPQSAQYRFSQRLGISPLGWETGLCVYAAKLDSAGCLHRNSARIHEPASLSPASWCLRPVWEERREKHLFVRLLLCANTFHQGGILRRVLRTLWVEWGACMTH